MAAKTGLGCTLIFTTTSAWTPQYLSISGPQIGIDFLETSHLGTTGGFKTFVRNDLVDGGEYTAEFFWDAAGGYPPFTVISETITVTNNDTGAATEAFTGSISGFDGPTRTVGSLQMATLTIKVLGAITFTA